MTSNPRQFGAAPRLSPGDVLRAGILAAAGLAVAVPGLITAPRSAEAQVVNVYSARHYDTDDEMYSRFEEETGIQVNVLEASSDQLIQRIEQEGEFSPADVFLTVDAGRLWRAEEAGILQSFTSSTINQRIPEQYRDPEGTWLGLSLRARVIMIREGAIQRRHVQTYADLADDRLEGRLCIRSSSNIYNQSLVGSLIANEGRDWTRQWAGDVVDNFARPPAGGDTAQIRAVAAGECDVAVSNHYYLARMRAEGSEQDRELAARIQTIFPNQDGRGTHVNISGAGLVAGAPNRDNAIRFLEFLTSEPAQELIAMGNYEFPIIDGVPVADVIEPWADYSFDTVNADTFGSLNPDALRLMDEAGWQ